MVIPVSVPAFIDQTTFDAVQARMNDRNPKVTPPQVVGGPTLLTGLIQRVSADSPTSRFSASSRRVRPLVSQPHRLVLKLFRKRLLLNYRA